MAKIEHIEKISARNRSFTMTELFITQEYMKIEESRRMMELETMDNNMSKLIWPC